MTKLEQRLNGRVLSRRQFLAGSLAGGLAAGLGNLPGRARAQQKPGVVLRAITPLETKYIAMRGMFEFIKRVEKNSGGELRIDWKGGPEAVPTFQGVGAVSKGVFDVIHTANAFYATNLPESVALVAEPTVSPRALRASGVTKLVDEIHREKLGVAFLGISTSGMQFTFLSKVPIENLDYFKGKKIRTVPQFTPLILALGGAPVTIAPGEVYTAMERGVVDAMAWPTSGIEDFKFYEVAKFMLLPAYYVNRYAILMNQRTLEKLPANLQKVLNDSIVELEGWSDDFYLAEQAKEWSRLREKGFRTAQLPDAEAKKFLRIADDALWEKIIKDSPNNGPRLKEAFSKAAQLR